jgi:hypothetical protein
MEVDFAAEGTDTKYILRHANRALQVVAGNSASTRGDVRSQGQRNKAILRFDAPSSTDGYDVLVALLLGIPAGYACQPTKSFSFSPGAARVPAIALEHL